ncbi:hypothetical protein BS78_03G202000 [Paspalum vaginatum]|nr:hypothetical protein BS78_03G202000 [Paspalum vaginatum]
MMHGPCGKKNWNCPCMKKRKCSKFYPKEFQEETNFTDTWFTLYQRRDTDNKCVVPHNIQLIKRYQAHINVEFVNKSKVLKYLCKYVNKGPGQAKIFFERIRKDIDEIKEYLDCRYIYEQDALWSEKQCLRNGRLYYVNPTEGERFYLCMLLMIVKGATCYADIRTYNGFRYQTFKEACATRGLLNDDNKWYNTFEEATKWATSSQLRNLFITMLTFCGIKNEREFYNKNWKKMVDDIHRQLILEYYPIEYTPNEAELQDLLLEQLEKILCKNGQNINSFNLPHKLTHDQLDTNNQLIVEEMNYDVQYLKEETNKLYLQLNKGQKEAFHQIVDSVIDNYSIFYFVSGHGGTGKTFLWNTIVFYLRAQKKIVLTIASSDVASLLLPNGRTTHSRFRIPVDIDDMSIYEALMTNKQCFETLDRSLRDIMSEKWKQAANIPFGAKVVVLGGDPKQILPIIENWSKSQIINASIVKSYLWKHVTIIHFTENVRLKNINPNSTQYKDLESFSNWILSIGNGTAKSPLNIDDDSDSVIIEIPKILLIQTINNKIQALVDYTYPEFQNRFQQPEYLKERAILATINEVVDEINNYMVDLIPSDKKEYLSADSISKYSDTCNDANILYPIEYLNTLNANNYPPHKLVLKVGVPIMLLRNLNQSLGLCNGTRLIITNLRDNVLKTIIITGTHVGQRTYIPRINLTTRGSHWPFTLNRRQYRVKVCYSMTINKSQWQTISNVGLYVAVSRVTAKSGLKILIKNEDGTCGSTTHNIVYKEILILIQDA